jgi:Cdc6-like AAA superfamily ATPase
MSLNFENQGVPIAIVKNSKSKKTPIISVDDKEEARHQYPSFELQGNECFQVIPNPEQERTITYITGQSGSGKSYWAKMYCDEYKRMYPKREIYLFSSLKDDKGSIDQIKNLKRIKLNKELLDDDLTAEDFEKSMVIFDDCDCLTDKKMKNKVQGIFNSIAETGRHFSVSCIYTSHLPCKGNETKTILNESHNIVFFPSTLGGRSLKYLLDSYLGLDKKQIEKVKNLKSRWVCICKTFPQVIISEKDALITKSI